MVDATRVRFRYRIANTKVVRPAFWLGDESQVVVPTVTELQAIADDARAAVVSSGLMAAHTNQVAFEEMEAQNMTRTGAGTPTDPFQWTPTTIQFESSGSDIVGTTAGDSLPPQNAYVYSMRSSQPGSRGRSRFFGPPLVDSEVNSLGIIDTARVTQLNTDILAVIQAAAAAAPATVSWVAASLIHNDVNDIISAALNTTVRSQRRRVT